VLFDYLDDFCTAYLDDIIVYSEDESQHTEHVRKVLLRLRAAGLQAEIKKYEFSVTKTKFLSYIVSTEEGIGPDLVKVVVVAN